jgi:hypothetical protein
MYPNKTTIKIVIIRRRCFVEHLRKIKTGLSRTSMVVLYVCNEKLNKSGSYFSA